MCTTSVFGFIFVLLTCVTDVYTSAWGHQNLGLNFKGTLKGDEELLVLVLIKFGFMIPLSLALLCFARSKLYYRYNYVLNFLVAGLGIAIVSFFVLLIDYTHRHVQ